MLYHPHPYARSDRLGSEGPAGLGGECPGPGRYVIGREGEDAGDVLTLADAVTVELARAGLDRLTLTDVATGVLGSGRASDTLPLGSLATVQAVWNRRRTDILTLTDVAGGRTASIDLDGTIRPTIRRTSRRSRGRGIFPPAMSCP